MAGNAGKILGALGSGGMLGSVLSSLFSGPGDGFLRDEKFAPRKLLVRAGQRALDRQRETIMTSFGFTETSAEGVAAAQASAKIGLITDPSIRKNRMQGDKRKTLI